MSKFDKTGTFWVVFDVAEYSCDAVLGDITVDAITDYDMGANLWWIADENRKVVWENTAEGRIAANKWWWERYG